MELRLTVLRPGQSLSSREHRLVFETNAPRNNPVPQGGINDFDRLHQGSDTNANQRPEGQDRRDNVYDRMTNRQAAYRDEVAKLEQYISKTTAATESQGTIKRVNGLIENLRNVYQQEYTDRNGTRRTYENGMYATVNAVESAYNNIETIITSLEGDLARANGGRLPDGLRSYQDRVRDARTADALAGRGTGSVDVRTYSVPFRPESASETSTYSLLRIPANFQFEWGSNPRVAEIISGKYDIQGGMSNGIKYLRLQPAAATALARENLTVPVAIESAPGVVRQRTTARFVADSPIVENPNAGNTLIHIEYSTPTAPGPNGGPDLPPGGDGVPPGGNGNGNNENGNNNQEQNNAKAEGERKAFHETWEKNFQASETARISFIDSDGLNDTAHAIEMGRAEQAALVTERSHLELRGALPPVAEGGDNSRMQAYEKRVPEITAREAEVAERLTQLQSYVDFAGTQEGLKNGSDTAFNAIPTVPTDVSNVEAWTTYKEAVGAAQTTADAEYAHLITFDNGSPAPSSGANEPQRTAVADRITEMSQRIRDLVPTAEAAQEGLDEAVRARYEEEFQKLNAASGEAKNAFIMLDGRGALEVSTTQEAIDAGRAELDALVAERSHLEVRGSLPPVTNGDNSRQEAYEKRAGEIPARETEVTERLAELQSFVDFATTQEGLKTASDTAFNAIPGATPDVADVEAWTDLHDAIKEAQTTADAEYGHLITFEQGEPAPHSGANDVQRTDVADRITAMAARINEMVPQEAEAQEGLNEAMRTRFENEYQELHSTSETARISFIDSDGLDDTQHAIDMGRAEQAALTAERSHLELRGSLPPVANGADDSRQEAYEKRAGEITERETAVQERIDQLQSYVDFAATHEPLKNESETTFNTIPTTDPAVGDVEGWEALKSAIEAADTAATAEYGHIITFETGDPAPTSGANDTQRTANADRITDMSARIRDLQDDAVDAQKGLNEALRTQFEEKYQELHSASETARISFIDSDGLDDTQHAIDMGRAEQEALTAERSHLELRGSLPPVEAGADDSRQQAYETRAGEIPERETAVQERIDQLQSYVDFAATHEPLKTESETKFDAIPDAPAAANDADGWRARSEAIQAASTSATAEYGHIITFETGDPAPTSGANEGQRTANADRITTVANRINSLETSQKEATEGLRNAERAVFMEQWGKLTEATTQASINYIDTIPDQFGAKVEKGTEYITAIDAELAHLSTAITAYPASEGVDPNPAAMAARALELGNIRLTTQAEIANHQAMQQFDATRTENSQASAKTEGPANGAINAFDGEPENLPSWTARLNAVETHMASLNTERAHLATLPAAGRTAEYATGVQDRIDAIDAALKTLAVDQARLQAGVDTARVDNITNIETAGDIRVNRTQRVERIINRFQQITISKGGNTLTVLAQQNTPDTNRDFPRVERTAGNNNAVITAGNAPAGTYEITVGTGATAKRSRIIVSGRRAVPPT